MNRVAVMALAAVAAVFAVSGASAATPDHLQCFKIKDDATKLKYSATLTPSDPIFAPAPGCTIKLPAKYLCVDTEKSDVVPTPPGAPEGVQPPSFLCYKTKCPATEVSATVGDQFGDHNVTVIKTGLLCAPVDTALLTTTTTLPPDLCAGVTCDPTDQCHQAGICNPSTGLCSNPAAPDGGACDDGNACTQADTCQTGVCTGSDPVVCSAIDQCHAAGSCNVATGVCSNPALPNGTACSDGDSCTHGDTCTTGTCSSGPVEPMVFLSPGGGPQLPPTLYLDASESNSGCATPLDYYWTCQGTNTQKCNNFLAATGGASGGDVASYEFPLGAGETHNIGVQVCLRDTMICSTLVTNSYDGGS